MKLIKTYNGNYINADNVTIFEIHHDLEKSSNKATGQIVARMPQINLNSRGCTYENLFDNRSERYEYERDVFRYIISETLYVEDAGFEEILIYYNNETILNALNACIAEEWGEGVAIVQQEIARRGLHVEDNEERFEL